MWSTGAFLKALIWIDQHYDFTHITYSRKDVPKPILLGQKYFFII